MHPKAIREPFLNNIEKHLKTEASLQENGATMGSKIHQNAIKIRDGTDGGPQENKQENTLKTTSCKTSSVYVMLHSEKASVFNMRTKISLHFLMQRNGSSYE